MIIGLLIWPLENKHEKESNIYLTEENSNRLPLPWLTVIP